MSAATEALGAMIASCRQIETLVPDAMADLTKAVQAEVERTIAAGTTAYGEPWKPTQSGEQPLKHAAKAVKVMSVNRTIFVQVTGVEARHHLGRVKGKRKRSIIPERGLPSTMANALREVLVRRFNEATKP